MLLKYDPVICLGKASAPSDQARMFRSFWCWSSALSSQLIEVESVSRFSDISSLGSPQLYRVDIWVTGAILWPPPAWLFSADISLTNMGFPSAKSIHTAWLLHHSVVCQAPRWSECTEILTVHSTHSAYWDFSSYWCEQNLKLLLITACATWIQMIKKFWKCWNPSPKDT